MRQLGILLGQLQKLGKSWMTIKQISMGIFQDQLKAEKSKFLMSVVLQWSVTEMLPSSLSQGWTWSAMTDWPSHTHSNMSFSLFVLCVLLYHCLSVSCLCVCLNLFYRHFVLMSFCLKLYKISYFYLFVPLFFWLFILLPFCLWLPIFLSPYFFVFLSHFTYYSVSLSAHVFFVLLPICLCLSVFLCRSISFLSLCLYVHLTHLLSQTVAKQLTNRWTVEMKNEEQGCHILNIRENASISRVHNSILFAGQKFFACLRVIN